MVPNTPTAQSSPDGAAATALSCDWVTEIDCGSSLQTVPSQRMIVPNWPTATADWSPVKTTLFMFTCDSLGGSGGPAGGRVEVQRRPVETHRERIPHRQRRPAPGRDSDACQRRTVRLRPLDERARRWLGRPPADGRLTRKPAVRRPAERSRARGGRESRSRRTRPFAPGEDVDEVGLQRDRDVSTGSREDRVGDNGGMVEVEGVAAIRARSWKRAPGVGDGVAYRVETCDDLARTAT